MMKFKPAHWTHLFLKGFPLMMGIILITACKRDSSLTHEPVQCLDRESVRDYACRLEVMKYVFEDGKDHPFDKKVITELIENRFFAEAIYAIRHLLNEGVADPDLFYHLAVAERNRHDYQAALLAIDQALTLADDLKYHYEKDIIYSEKLIWDNIEKINRTISEGSVNDTIILKRAEMFLTLEEYGACMFDAGQVLSSDSLNEKARFLKVRAAFYENHYPEALQDLDFLTDIAKGERKAFYAKYSREIKKIQNNMEKLNNSADPVLYVNLARSLSEIGEDARALTLLNSGLEKNPSNKRLIYARLLVYIKTGELRKAEEQVKILESMGVKVDEAIKKIIGSGVE